MKVNVEWGDLGGQRFIGEMWRRASACRNAGVKAEQCVGGGGEGGGASCQLGLQLN